MIPHGTGAEPRTSRRIPDFQNREEEAEFWDTHDFTDFLDQSWPVQVRVADPLTSSLVVDLDREAWEHLDRLAREQGTGPSALARAWIAERLRPHRSGTPDPE